MDAVGTDLAATPACRSRCAGAIVSGGAEFEFGIDGDFPVCKFVPLVVVVVESPVQLESSYVIGIADPETGRCCKSGCISNVDVVISPLTSL